jgi:hypothetical protein
MFLPASAFKSVRRAAADELLRLRAQHSIADGMAEQLVLPQLLPGPSSSAADPPAQQQGSSTPAGSGSAGRGTPSSAEPASRAGVGSSGELDAAAAPAQLRVLCRTHAQVLAAVQVPWLAEVIVDFLEVRGGPAGFRPSVLPPSPSPAAAVLSAPPPPRPPHWAAASRTVHAMRPC